MINIMHKLNDNRRMRKSCTKYILRIFGFCSKSLHIISLSATQPSIAMHRVKSELKTKLKSLYWNANVEKTDSTAIALIWWLSGCREWVDAGHNAPNENVWHRNRRRMKINIPLELNTWRYYKQFSLFIESEI